LFGVGSVVGGGDADGGGPEVEVGGEQVGDGGEGREVVGGGEGCAALVDPLVERCELDEVGVSEFEFAIDAKVIPPEGARAHDGDAKGRHATFGRRCRVEGIRRRRGSGCRGRRVG
jgi:hypothetical protein